MREQPDRAPDSPDPRDLEEAAHAWGIETSYWDVWGQQHQAAPAIQMAILGALGVDARSRASLLQAMEERKQRPWRSPFPRNLLFNHSLPPAEIAVSLPGSQADSHAVLAIRFEEGSSMTMPIEFAQLPVTEESVIDGQRFVRKQVPFTWVLPMGYHEIALELAGQTLPPARLIVHPGRTYQPEWLESGRTAGLAVSLYGLRSRRNWGCGDTTDLQALIDWVAEQSGASFIGLNPLHDIPNRYPYNISPYLPNSTFFRNPIYLDIEKMEDFASCRRAAALLESPSIQREIAALRNTPLVEYERVYRLKLRFLKPLFETFLSEWRAKTPRTVELAGYIEREGELLHRFAVHAVLDQAMHRRCRDVWNWPGWPAEYQDPESAATQAFARKHWRTVLFHKYVQWQLDRQFAAAQEHAVERGLRIGLYHDLALATDRFGADLWAHRDFFISGCRVGAPPDDFSPKGQDWAFPPPSIERHEQDGYRLFAESIRRNSRHGGALRIDHVMRFFRLYWIPDGEEATEGTYVRDHFEALLAVLALESVRQKVLVVGEDLGTVPDYIREVLYRFGILSYRLLYFEQNQGWFRSPQEYPRNALVSATTHDLPTLAGFWLGRDIELRHDSGLLPDEATYRSLREQRDSQKQRLLDKLAELQLLPDWFPRNAAEVPELTGELHNAIVGFLATTPSQLMLLNQEDLLKETEQQNLPGTTYQYPNWRRKMKCTVEELWTSPDVQAFTAMFRDWLDRTQRLNSAVIASEPAAT